MDLASIATRVSTLVNTCARVKKELDELKGQFFANDYKLENGDASGDGASSTFSELQSESSDLSTTLSQIQAIINENVRRKMSKLSREHELVAAFEILLRGCCSSIEGVETELRKLKGNFKHDAEGDVALEKILMEVRQMQSAVCFLPSALKTDSTTQLRELLLESNNILQSPPPTNTPNSPVSTIRKKQRKSPPPRLPLVPASYSAQNAVITPSKTPTTTAAVETQFTFDSEIMDSKAYRRALVIEMRRGRTGSLDSPHIIPVDAMSLRKRIVLLKVDVDGSSVRVVRGSKSRPTTTTRDSGASIITNTEPPASPSHSRSASLPYCNTPSATQTAFAYNATPPLSFHYRHIQGQQLNLSEEERRSYRQLFNTIDPEGRGVAENWIAKKLFECFNLSPETLERIWTIVQSDSEENPTTPVLQRDQFALFLRLISFTQRGYNLDNFDREQALRPHPLPTYYGRAGTFASVQQSIMQKNLKGRVGGRREKHFRSPMKVFELKRRGKGILGVWRE